MGGATGSGGAQQRLAVVLAGLVIAACGSDAATGPGSTPAVPDATGTSMSQGAEDVISLEGGDPISVALLACISGDYPQLGTDAIRASEMAIEDHGQIQGRPVRLDMTEDDLCNGPGGRAGAETIVSHPDIVGVIGPSFSDAAVTAAPIVTSTGRVLVSGTTDSPLLTSIGGERGEEWHEGYFTTAGGVGFQGHAAGKFAANALEAETAITIAAAGDLFAEATATEFATSFEAAGGTIAASLAVGQQAADIPALLQQAGRAHPGVIFLTAYWETPEIIDQIATVDGLAQADLISWAWNVSNPSDEDLFLGSTRSGMYHTIPEDVTLSRAEAREFNADYVQRFGEGALTPYAESNYDAATILLNAIDRAARPTGPGMTVDLAELREAMYSTDHQGASGHLVCDEFGDCSAAAVDVVRDETGNAAFIIQESYQRSE